MVHIILFVFFVVFFFQACGLIGKGQIHVNTDLAHILFTLFSLLSSNAMSQLFAFVGFVDSICVVSTMAVVNVCNCKATKAMTEHCVI